MNKGIQEKKIKCDITLWEDSALWLLAILGVDPHDV